MTTQLWIPSDDLVAHDPIASQKITTPFAPISLEAQGIKLFDVDDDAANEAAACVVLASLEDDGAAGDEHGECDDDERIDDPADADGVDADV